jgi:hypothetical protein
VPLAEHLPARGAWENQQERAWWRDCRSGGRRGCRCDGCGCCVFIVADHLEEWGSRAAIVAAVVNMMRK